MVTVVTHLTVVSGNHKGTLKFHSIQQYEEDPYSLGVNGGTVENLDFHLHMAAGGGMPTSPTSTLSEEVCYIRFK